VKLTSKPGCNDGERVPTEFGEASVIISRFWTTHPIAAMARFIEPTRWVECGRPFWREVREVAGTRSTFAHGDVKGYRARFVEVVDLPGTTVTVRLDVIYQERPHLYRLDFDLASDDPRTEVTVDRGFLSVTDTTLGDDDEGTLVEAAKAIRFTKPLLNKMPDLACDGGWVYMMINMALNGAGVTVPPGALSQGTTAAPSPGSPQLGPIVAVIEREIENWTKQASDSLADHSASAKDAVRKIVAPRHDPRWINDVIGMSDGAIKTTGVTVGAWRRILRELEKMGSE
jgi:hypothetical protein